MAIENPILQAASSTSTTSSPSAETVEPSRAEKLAALQDQLRASSVRTADTIQKTQDTVVKTEAATGILTNAIQSATEATRVIQATAQTANLQAQNKTIDTLSSSNVQTVQSNLLHSLTEDAARSLELQDELEDITDDEFTGIGVLDTLINKFRSQSTLAEQRVNDQSIARTNSQLGAIAQASTQVAQTNALTKKTLNEATIAANLDFITAEGAIKGAEADLVALGSNAKVLATLSQANAAHTANLREQFNLADQEEERAFRREQIAQTKKAWEKTDIADDKKLQLEAILAESIRKGQVASGVAVDSPEQAIWGLSRTGDTGARYDKLLEIGGEVNPVIGNTPAEAMESLGTVSPSGNYRATKGSKLLQAIATKQTEALAQSGAKQPKTQEEAAAQYNSTADKVMTVFASNIAGGDNSNPYQAPPMDSLAEFAMVKNSVLYQKVLQGTQLAEAIPQTVIDEAIAAAESRLISAEEAADGIIALYTAASDINNTVDGGFRRYGLPDQTSFITTLDTHSPGVNLTSRLLLTGSVFSTGSPAIGDAATQALSFTPFQKVDLMDRASVLEYLIKSRSVQRAAGTVTP